MMRSSARRLGGGLLAFLLAVLATVVAPGVASAQMDPRACAAQADALRAINQQIDAHNARPHTFEVPRQAAALAAYDADAYRLNAAAQTALGALQACAEALQALTAAAPNSPPLEVEAPAGVRSALNDARAKIPTNWKPPAAPAPGQQWRVLPNSPVRPIYDVLRREAPATSKTPALQNAYLQGRPRPQIGDPDPAYPGRTIRAGAAGPGGPTQSRVRVDHIVPLAELVNLPRFTQLSAENMYIIAKAPVNYQWLSLSANSAKSSRSVVNIRSPDPQWQADQFALQNRVRQQLTNAIAKLLASQG